MVKMGWNKFSTLTPRVASWPLFTHHTNEQHLAGFKPRIFFRQKERRSLYAPLQLPNKNVIYLQKKGIVVPFRRLAPAPCNVPLPQK